MAVHKIPDTHVFNFDETRILLGDGGNMTLEKCGAKAVKLYCTGNKKGITVLAGISAASVKLPLSFVFSGKSNGPKNVKVPLPHKKFVTLKGWMNGSMWNQWTEQVLLPSTKLSSLVINMDHTQMKNLQHCVKENTDI